MNRDNVLQAKKISKGCESCIKKILVRILQKINSWGGTSFRIGEYPRIYHSKHENLLFRFVDMYRNCLPRRLMLGPELHHFQGVAGPNRPRDDLSYTIKNN